MHMLQPNGLWQTGMHVGNADEKGHLLL